MLDQIDQFDPRDGREIGDVLDMIEELARVALPSAEVLAARVLERIREEYHVHLVSAPCAPRRWRSTDAIPTMRDPLPAPSYEVRDGREVRIVAEHAPKWGIEEWSYERGFVETETICEWEDCGEVLCCAWDGDSAGFCAVIRTRAGWWQVWPK